GGQPPPAAGAGDQDDPAPRAGADRRPHRPNLGPPRPGDAAADRRAGQRPLRLAPARHRGRRPLLGRAARRLPGGAAGGARRPLTQWSPATSRPIRWPWTAGRGGWCLLAAGTDGHAADPALVTPAPGLRK